MRSKGDPQKIGKCELDNTLSMIDFDKLCNFNTPTDFKDTGGTRKLTALNNINFVDIAPFIKNENF